MINGHYRCRLEHAHALDTWHMSWLWPGDWRVAGSMEAEKKQCNLGNFENYLASEPKTI